LQRTRHTYVDAEVAPLDVPAPRLRPGTPRGTGERVTADCVVVRIGTALAVSNEGASQVATDVSQFEAEAEARIRRLYDYTRDEEYPDFVVLKDLPMTTRDGHTLVADAYVPARNGVAVQGEFPAILDRTPYDKNIRAHCRRAQQRLPRRGAPEPHPAARPPRLTGRRLLSTRRGAGLIGSNGAPVGRIRSTWSGQDGAGQTTPQISEWRSSA
jgi:hypothetical protein